MASATATLRAELARRAEQARTFLSRISIRLLAFNILLVFLPAAGLLTLDTYERQMLRTQEQAMVQQGRVLAAALGGPEGLDDAFGILRNLGGRQQARLRVVDADGHLVADSSRLSPEIPAQTGQVSVVGASDADKRVSSEEPGWLDDVLYWMGALPFRLHRWLSGPPPPLDSGEFYSGRNELLGPEIESALRGRYGAATRISGGQRSVTMYVAIPIRSAHEISGAVLVSQSTYGILQALYAVRLDVFKVVLAALAAAAILSLLVSTTIARPLRQLRSEALAVVDRRGRLQGSFRSSTTRDEIGDLTRALEQLTARMREHLSFIERVAAEVSHEFKNPLASIRTATELLPSVDDPDQRRRFLQIVQRDVARMERLLAGVREISRIDAQIDDEEPQPVDLSVLLESIVDGYRLRSRHGVSFDLSKPDGAVVVRGVPDRLIQAFENLLDNALSFSPGGSAVRVAIGADSNAALVTVTDEGPGVPPEHLEKVFARFFSYRPGTPNANGHAGLGLPIAKAIVEGYGGTIEVASRAEGGASFTVRLPMN